MAGAAGLVTKPPNPIDKHVGSRVRMRRVLIGMSQERLGDALGLTFQQVQKYEKGTNRIGASRLQQIARVLRCRRPSFRGCRPARRPRRGQLRRGGRRLRGRLPGHRRGLQLNKAFVRIKEGRVRKKIIDLVTALADDAAAAAAGDPPEDGNAPPMT